MNLKEKLFNAIFDKAWEFKTEDIVPECEKITDNFAIEFAEWVSYKYKFLENRGWFNGSYQLEMGIFKTSDELLNEFKKEKGL